jgi:murein tripeptide amidase MpaA
MFARTGVALVPDEDMREKARRWQARAADAADPRQREIFERLAADYEAAAVPARRHGG